MLLFRYGDARADGTWWGPPGGGLAPGEDHLASLSAEAIQELRWWSAEELRSSQIVATPRDLPDLLDRIARGDLPDADQDLGT